MPGDPYSPPCYAFSGDNGGSTYQGVTDKEIVVTVRTLEGPSAAEIFADISGESVSDSPEAYRNTAHRARPSTSRPASRSTAARSSSSSSSRARATAPTSCSAAARRRRWPTPCAASKEIGAFADISAITIPYADALAQQKVVNIGSPYPSREWFVERRPYSWSLFPDGTNVVESSAAAFTRRLAAGLERPSTPAPAIKGKPRKFGDRGAGERRSTRSR